MQASKARLFKEYHEVQREKIADPDIQLVCDESNIFKWTAFVKGPSETPYEGGVFQLSFSVSDQYPLQPPQVRFLTKIFHPNVHFKVGWIFIGKSMLGKVKRVAITIGGVVGIMGIDVATVVISDGRSGGSYQWEWGMLVLEQHGQRAQLNGEHEMRNCNLEVETGEICLDILKNAWSPAWTLQSVCRAIIALMAHPEPDSPLNCDSGNLLRSGDVRGYQSMARMYTRLAAMPKKG
ncbi:hypothetical protein V8G54_006794 [Vigna mungo]|uniref:UBC core domain-containing protein n=1 Tax=Vigna mungo TaxID=3915 RepID=A0AAQ3S6R7_VIGMU